MKTQTILLLTIVILSFSILTYPVRAESGYLNISAGAGNSYSADTGGSSGILSIPFNAFKFDITDYNYISQLSITLTTGFTFGHASNTGSFTVDTTNGNAGSGSWVYDSTTKKLIYYFNNAHIVYSPIILMGSAPDISATNPSQFVKDSCDAVSATKPIMLLDSTLTGLCSNSGISAWSYISQTQKAFSNTYDVSYRDGLVIVNVTKSMSTVSSKIEIRNETAQKYIEPTFNTDFFSYGYVYDQGLILKMTDSSGNYDQKTVNSTGISGFVPPEESPTDNINSATGVGIIFDSSSYSIGAVANISWVRTQAVPLLCTDYIRLQTPSSKYDLVVSPSSSGYTKELLSIIGTHSVSFERDCLFSGTETLDSDVAEVGTSEQASYVYAPTQVAIGKLFNATYLIGFDKTIGSTVWLRDYSFDEATQTYSSTYESWVLSGSKGVETNASILVTKTGKHLLKLCDVLLGCKASTTLTAYINGSGVTTNISVSNITIDKTSYSYGETILVKTAVDNTNWSTKQIVVEYENYGSNTIQNQKYTQNQVESFPLYISDLTFSGSGISRLRLTAKNDTESVILAFANFTLSNVDSEGYGLSVIGDTNCIKDTIQINVIVPSGEVGNLTVSADNAQYNKYYTVNGTKTISYKYQIDGTYYITLSVNGEAKRVIVKSVSSSGVCAIITPVTTYKGINGTWTATNENIKETCSYWDIWVRAIFGVQGVNDVTRILFALGAIVAMMFIGLIASKGNFGVAIILGFFPYAFFTYLTLSTPCGQYMPLWINIFIALIIGIKMKWFS